MNATDYFFEHTSGLEKQFLAGSEEVIAFVRGRTHYGLKENL